MVLIISLTLSFLLIFLCKGTIKKHPLPFYIAAAATGAAAIIFTWSGVVLPQWVEKYLMSVLARGGLAGALFIIVMWTGAFPNGSRIIKVLFPIRAELSIIASILTLSHNIAYGRTYFVRLFTKPAAMPVTQIIAAVCSLVMIAIMLPLFITSFPAVRRKMKAAKWKRLQRTAYAFYLLMYIHVLLLHISAASKGSFVSRFNVILYTAIFLAYLICRVAKAVIKEKDRLPKFQHITAVSSAVICCAAGIIMPTENRPIPTTADSNIVISEVTTADSQTESTVTASTETEAAVLAGTTFPIPAEITEAAKELTLKDGIFEGKAYGYDSYITVSVKIDNGQITDIEITDEAEDMQYLSRSKSVIGKVLANGGTDGVDTVSGATYTSGGILNAIKNALSAASE